MPIDESRDFIPVRIAVLTISDTRSAADDRSGDTLVERLEGAGHVLAARYIERDDKSAIVARLHAWIDDPDIDVILTTGGTGVTGRDVTPEALAQVQDKEIPGFGECGRVNGARGRRFDRRGARCMGRHIGNPTGQPLSPLQLCRTDAPPDRALTRTCHMVYGLALRTSD